MVNDGFSTQKIRQYLHRFVLWWVNTSESWTPLNLLTHFLEACWDQQLAQIARGLLPRYIKESDMRGCGSEIARHNGVAGNFAGAL